ncbi:MAG TPA: RlmE family RNA methyltransferase [Rickettsiales bacterium]|nr:RlmE family RNA methyltransferase [Rickettsiales bacterium]
MTKKPSDKSSRGLSVRVKTARGRSVSSSRWLQRQLNDPYVAQAKKDGYRSRAAYKLTELDEKFQFLKAGKQVVDLGAAPGGWSQVAVAKCGEGNVVGIDLLEISPVPGATLLQMDFMDDAAPQALKDLMGEADIVLSDMAPNASGQPSLDHLRIVLLVEAAFEFAMEVLKPGGVFVAKVWQGGTENKLLERMKKHFVSVKHAKPKASRQDSAETFVVATGFRP